MVWKKYLNDRAIFFVDHGGVLASMITGSSRDSLWRSLLLILKKTDARYPCLAWYSRVPSASNLSDGPSRGEWDFLKRWACDKKNRRLGVPP